MPWVWLGANLTVANHAFFVSPLLTPSKETYVAYESQAIGRIRRYACNFIGLGKRQPAP
jgi:hypothetical protein